MKVKTSKKFNCPKKIPPWNLPRTVTPKLLSSGTITFEESLLQQLLSRQLLLIKLPPRKLLPSFCPPDNYPSLDNYPKTTGPLWVSPLDYCWEMFRVESELHLSEASVATGDPSRRGIVNPLLELWSFSFFSLVLCY